MKKSIIRTVQSFFGSIFLCLWLSIITPPFSLLACLIAPLPAMIRYRIIARWSWLTIIGARFFCGIRYRVIGQENIPRTPSVFLSRHESAWESIAYQHILPPQAFVIKRQLLNIPFFGWGLRQMSPIAIDRRAGHRSLRQVLAQGSDRLQRGFHVIIFPEGTRLLPRDDRPYFPGGAWLAKETKVSIIPIAVNSGHCWPRGRFLKRRGMITVQIGPAIDTTNLSVSVINEKAKSWIGSVRQIP